MKKSQQDPDIKMYGYDPAMNPKRQHTILIEDVNMLFIMIKT